MLESVRQVRWISILLVLGFIEYPKAKRTLAANSFILGTERIYQPKGLSLRSVYGTSFSLGNLDTR